MSDIIPAWYEGKLVPMDKIEVHRLGLKHPAVSVFVIDDRDTQEPRTLIQRRAAGKYHSGDLWANGCCTHPHWEEDPAQAACRRLQEELGLTGLYPTLVDRIDYRADVGGGLTENERVDLFIAWTQPDAPISPDPAEVSETRWVGLYDLAAEAKRYPERFAPWLRIYLSEHFDRILSASRS